MPRPAEPKAPLTRGKRLDLVTRCILPRVIDANAASPTVMKAVLFALDQFTAWHETCWPSTRLLAECCCCSARVVQRSLAQMIDLGLITYEARKTGGGKRIPNRRWFSNRAYRIEYDALALLPRAGEPQRVVGDSLTGTTNGRDDLTQDNGPIEGDRSDATESASPSDRPAVGDSTTGTKTNIQSEEDRRVALQTSADPIDWKLAARPHLLRLGVALKRCEELCREAGSKERVVEILHLIRLRHRSIKNPAAYFAEACGHPDWKANAEETRRIERATA